jgi:hypothetical protein
LVDRDPNDSLTSASRCEWGIAWLFGAGAMFSIVGGLTLLPGVDSYYHLKMARLLPQLGFIHEFPWLHWTIFRDRFVSHHYGFHVILMPLVWLSDLWTGDLIVGGKVAVVGAMGVTAVVFHALLKTLKVPLPLLWTFLLGCLPWHFWLRMTYVRAPIVALPLLLLAVLFYARGRFWLVCLAACLFTNIYLGAVVAVLVPICFTIGQILVRRTTSRTWLLLLFFFAGLAAGLVISPYFPENLPFLKVQLFDTGLGAVKDFPSEWRSFDTWTLAAMSAPLAVIWSGSLILRLRRNEPLGGTSIALLLMNLAFLGLTLKARRFIEYWPVFALLNAADMARFSAEDISELLSGSRAWAKRVAFLAPVVAIALALPALLTVRCHARPGVDHAALRPAMEYLSSHSPKGALVFADDWDVFPACFYYNTHNTYMVGLDPMFTIRQYPELWERYRLITRGKTPTELGGPFNVLQKKKATLDDIGDVFQAQYVLIMEDESKLYRQLLERGDRFKLVYPKETAWDGPQPKAALFKVLPRVASAAGT